MNAHLILQYFDLKVYFEKIELVEYHVWPDIIFYKCLFYLAEELLDIKVSYLLQL